MFKGWRSGRPGVLLADDMGLGKTVQTLAFACWLHAHYETTQEGRRGPILIVAPTALLKNWRAEHDTHLRSPGLGPIVELYGGGVRSFRKPGESRRDVEAGRAVLDRASLTGGLLHPDHLRDGHELPHQPGGNSLSACGVRRDPEAEDADDH
jgi:hypothetical protein